MDDGCESQAYEWKGTCMYLLFMIGEKNIEL